MRVALVIALLAVGAYSQTCKDRSATSSCLSWKKGGYCSQSGSRTYCAKTCGHCTGGTGGGGHNNRDCGYSKYASARIVNGQTATKGAYPWIASLQKNNGHYCGATLLNLKWVITASHCVEKAHNLIEWTIKLGAHNHYQQDASVQRLRIKRIIMHPSYSRSNLRADMAMIELATPAKLNERVTTACLPSQGVYPPVGKRCILAGWGAIRHPGNVFHTLQQTVLPVVTAGRSTCHVQTEVVCVGNGFKTQSNGKQQPNACRGDSGGPLMCQRSDGRWVLEGVASYVRTYCKYYTGYAPVNKYLSWIMGYLNS